MKDIKIFKRKVHRLLDNLRDYIDKNMPYKGDRESESQKMCLLNRISEVEHYINGTEQDDLMEEK